MAGLESGYAVTWQDSRYGTNNSIYATLVTKSGAIPDTEGTHVASGSEIHAYPDVASDGRDCLITFEIDGPAGPQRVRANLFSASRDPTLSTLDVIPISVWLESRGFSQGGTWFGTNKWTVWGGGGGAGGGRGFNVAVINLSSLTVEQTRNFDTWADRLTGGAHRAFVEYLDGIANGKLVLVAVGDEAGLNHHGQGGEPLCIRLPYVWVDEVIAKLQASGSTNITNICYWSSWGMIFVKGQPSPLAEGLGSGLTFPGSPVRLYASFPRTIPRPAMSISAQDAGFGLVRYTLAVTNVVQSRDIELQYSDSFPPSWQHLRTLNDPPTSVVQTSDFTVFSPARFFRAIMDGSVQLPPGF